MNSSTRHAVLASKAARKTSPHLRESVKERFSQVLSGVKPTESWISVGGRLCLAVAVVLSVFSSDFIVFAHVTAGFAAVMLAAVLAGAAVLVERRLDFDAADLAFSLCLLCMTVSACFAINSVVAFQTMDLWCVNGLAFFACRRLIRKKRDIRILVIAGLVAAALASATVQERIDQWGNYGRLGVGNDNTNHTAYCVAGLALLHCLWSLVERSRPLVNTVLACGLILFAYFLALLECRGAVISFLCFVCVTYCPVVIKLSCYRAAAVTLLLTAVIMSVGCFDGVLHKAGELLSGLRQVAHMDETLSGRRDIWPDVRGIFTEHMWLGVGPGNTVLVSRRGVGAHNLLLTIAVEGGVVSIVSFVLFFGLLFHNTAAGVVGSRHVSVLFLFMVYWLPIAFSGHWELTYLSWIVVAVVWQVGRVQRGDGFDETDRAQKCSGVRGGGLLSRM